LYAVRVCATQALDKEALAWGRRLITSFARAVPPAGTEIQLDRIREGVSAVPPTLAPSKALLRAPAMRATIKQVLATISSAESVRPRTTLPRALLRAFRALLAPPRSSDLDHASAGLGSLRMGLASASPATSARPIPTQQLDASRGIDTFQMLMANPVALIPRSGADATR